MQRKPKSNSALTTSEEGGVITFRVLKAGPTNEHGQPTDAVLTLDTAALSDEVRRAAMIHGLVQRIADRAALSRSTETGRSASPVE